MSVIQNSIRNEGLKYKKLPTPTTAPSLFKLHTLSAFIGPRGSGKTNAVVLLARRYLDDGSINRIFIISPTYDSNRIFELLEPQPGDVYKNLLTAIPDIDAILVQVQDMVKQYNFNKAFNKIYDKWVLFSEGRGPSLPPQEYNLLDKYDFKPMDRLPRPSPLLIIDDMSHSDIYTPSKKNPFINLCLRHRHLFKVGLSIFMLVQNFKTGVPKCLRQNIQQFFLWPTHDMTQLDSMYEEFANLCTREEFVQMFKKATAERHCFMSIDLNASEPLLRFRKNFDTLLLPQNQLTDEELNEISEEVKSSKKKARTK